jgi:uncharacterized protein YaiL (DUF2058 family)
MTPPDRTLTAAQVETLQERLRGLLREREKLRAAEADRGALERNRRAIVEAQWELSRALIARHHPSFQPA